MEEILPASYVRSVYAKGDLLLLLLHLEDPLLLLLLLLEDPLLLFLDGPLLHHPQPVQRLPLLVHRVEVRLPHLQVPGLG